VAAVVLSVALDAIKYTTFAMLKIV
jgi:hypothetical protein